VKNIIVFTVLCGLLLLAIFIGMQRAAPFAPQPAAVKEPGAGIPSVGRIQVLNGCGVAGAANKVADFLRARGFDVKNKGNAPTSNYPFTVVASRKKDGSIADQVARALSTDKIIVLRTADETYDVTVFVGADFSERTK
jgi:LytR cell envelope-related transcriptional attenuator